MFVYLFEYEAILIIAGLIYKQTAGGPLSVLECVKLSGREIAKKASLKTFFCNKTPKAMKGIIATSA
jgi:hypothetical protein